jgi:hypothetical protein
MAPQSREGNKPMVRKVLKQLIFVSGLAVLAACSGCMTNPGDGEVIGNRSTAVSFSGFTQNPNEPVAIWARHAGDGSWVWLGTTVTGSHALYLDGSAWYPWAMSRTIPSHCWRPSYGYYVAELAGTTPSGELYTFEQGFWNYRGQYANILEMYNERGAGTRVHVFAY